MGAKYQQQKRYEAETLQLFNKCQDAVMLSGFHIKKVDDAARSIQARTEADDFSIGEVVTVQLADDGTVTVLSKCVLPTQFIAWGKNKSNTNKFFAALDNVMNRKTS